MEKLKVVEIYFEQGNHAPSYVLENGEIRRPYYYADGTCQWVTDEYAKKHNDANKRKEPLPVRMGFLSTLKGMIK